MCKICNNKKTAIAINGVVVCHECLEFFKNSAVENGRTWHEEVEYQTKYISTIKKQQLRQFG